MIGSKTAWPDMYVMPNKISPLTRARFERAECVAKLANGPAYINPRVYVLSVYLDVTKEATPSSRSLPRVERHLLARTAFPRDALPGGDLLGQYMQTMALVAFAQLDLPPRRVVAEGGLAQRIDIV